MAPLKRKRPHDAAPVPEAPLVPTRATRSKPTSAVTRRATRLTATVAPQQPPWAADPEPRRRRRSSVRIHDTAGSDDERVENHIVAHDENENDRDQGEADQPSVLQQTKASLRGQRGAQAQARTHPEVAAAPQPESAAPKSASTTKPGRGRPRKHEQTDTRSGSSAASAQQNRPVLRATNQADPALRPKPVIRNRALRYHQRHHVDAAADAEDDSRPESALANGDTNGPVVPMQTHVEVDPAPSGRRVSAVGLPTGGGGGLQPPARSTQKKHHPPVSTIKTVPIMTQEQPRSVQVADHVAANSSKPFVPVIAEPMQSPPRPTKQHPEQRKSSVIDRNIDKVVFGNTCFSTWYHSPYGTEALGEISGNSVKASGVNSVHNGGSKDEALAHTTRKTKEDKLDRLYVCPSCFKYSKELVPWWQHVHLCERRGYVPGKKIYTHPKGRRPRQTQPDAATSTASKISGRKKRVLDEVPQSVDEDTAYQGEWSIYQVDGEEEGLFCQNLSLFAKLFLDNKSVFFDVVGFDYFLLVHTAIRHPSGGGEGEPIPHKHQIVGFFSKEKLSWDNNNLACILVFPPWQRKGLGALLMGVSYEISRREGMLGGPEKPISDLGKKGYKRFWAGEIAAWLLRLDTSREDEEVVVDVDECSKATWILPEDCLTVLREMGILEEAEDGPPPKKKKSVDVSATPEDGGASGEPLVNGKKEEEVKDVQRVRISKENVMAWVHANNISLEKACDADGFIEGYAIKAVGIEEEDL